MTTPKLPVDEGPRSLLRAYAEYVRPLTCRHGAAYWDFSCTGAPEAQDVVQEVEEHLSDLHADATAYDAVRRWVAESTGDALVDRQLEMLRREYRKAQVDEQLRKRVISIALKVEETCSVFRPEFEGERVSSNELDRILATEPDESRRRAAWEATRAVGARVADRVVELALLRNKQARALGFDDYFALALDDEEMERPVLDQLLGALRESSDASWSDVKTTLDEEHAELRGKAVADLRPWDYADRFLQSVPRSDAVSSTDPWFPTARIQRIAKRFYKGIGLPIDRLWEASDMMPRDGKYPHAFCIGIDNPGDVRVLCNLDGTTRWMETTLHEFGHALFNAHIDADLPWLLREPAHTFVTEAVAMFFGRLAKDPAWLVDVAGVESERAEIAGTRQREAQLVFARWALVVTAFEQAMYADPTADLDSLWWELVESIQGLQRPEDWTGRDWAAKVHIACYPAYYQNYLLGEVLASQFSAVLRERTGGVLVGQPDVGRFFIDLFRLGESLPWAETVEQHTGRPLSVDDWVSDFSKAKA